MQAYEVSLSEVDLENEVLRSCTELARPTDENFADQMSRVKQLLKRIPALERDVIELYFFHGKHQDQIGQMLGLTQQAVSHRMRRGLLRIEFLLTHPDLTMAGVRRDLKMIWPDAPEYMPLLIVHFSKTSSQTDTARVLQVQQQYVRRSLAAAVNHFQQCGHVVAQRYLSLLVRLLANRSILCDVPRGSCERRASRTSKRVTRSRRELAASA